MSSWHKTGQKQLGTRLALQQVQKQHVERFQRHQTATIFKTDRKSMKYLYVTWTMHFEGEILKILTVVPKIET